MSVIALATLDSFFDRSRALFRTNRHAMMTVVIAVAPARPDRVRGNSCEIPQIVQLCGGRQFRFLAQNDRTGRQYCSTAIRTCPVSTGDRPINSGARTQLCSHQISGLDPCGDEWLAGPTFSFNGTTTHAALCVRFRIRTGSRGGRAPTVYENGGEFSMLYNAGVGVNSGNPSFQGAFPVR